MEIPYSQDPLALFCLWFEQALNHKKIEEPRAVVLATCSVEGMPSSRVVLLKQVDHTGFIFYSNYSSRKGRELSQNPKASLCFFWPELARQVRVEGVTSVINGERSDHYFGTRSRESQLGAWASRQSQPCSEDELEKRIEKFTDQFQGTVVPRPEFWGGYCLEPRAIEFWLMKPHRLHTRYRYQFEPKKWPNEWQRQQLFP